MRTDGALAHGIGGDAADASTLEFIRLGFEHMVLGWDHLLFIAGVILICRNWWLAAKMITVFVIGHSTTLILASVLGWGLNPALVDLVIAISVLFVGFVAITDRKVDARIFAAVVLGFGLIHGLGLAARLDAIGLPDEGKLPKVLAFNLGIELGQLTVVLAYAALGYVATRVLAESADRGRQIASGVVVLGGAAAFFLTLIAVLNPPLGEPTHLALSERSTCVLEERTKEFPSSGGAHPQQLFTEPSDDSPMQDFGHTIIDGFVIVLYPQDTATEDIDTLRTYISSEKGEFVLGGPNPEPSDGFEVHNLYETLTCEELEMGTIVDFRNVWIESVEDAL
jgi:hydrogenase/urease accessory protein HupE